MSALRLRCKSEHGTQVLNNLTSSSTLLDLMEAIKKICDIEINAQKILSGFPPKSMKLEDKTLTLGSLSIKSGDTFTVVNGNKAKDTSSNNPEADRSDKPQPGVRRKEVPADNSCLFYSVFYVLEGFLEYETAKKLRAKIAEQVTSDPEKYSEAVLGNTQIEYSAWIQSDTSWGGAIELAILSEIFKVEIAAVDIKSLRLDIYGQDKSYSSRAYLIYDGIHYDPLYFDSCNKQLPLQTIFSCEDHAMLTKVMELAEIAHKARQFTDTGNFTLICVTCQKKLTGQKEAQEHAKQTGHGNFSEC
ncbi:ubiquitin thioesterase OTU1-like [Styela clava]